MNESMAPLASTPFSTQSGNPVPVCSFNEWAAALRALQAVDGMSALQLAEGCGFSFAMVVRFALGLSAHDGIVTVLFTDTFFGWIGLACARHLANGGSAVRVILAQEATPSSPESRCLLPPLQSRGAVMFPWLSQSAPSSLMELIDGSHNLLCAAADADTDTLTRLGKLVPVLNESAVPVHTIGAPLGVSLHGEIGKDPLYASSTLSLGMPLKVTALNGDILGRHYLADLSLSLEMYRKLGYEGPPIFAEQPVVRLL